MYEATMPTIKEPKASAMAAASADPNAAAGLVGNSAVNKGEAAVTHADQIDLQTQTVSA